MIEINERILKILQSPEDGTSLNKDLISESGIQYHQTDSGVIMLDGGVKRPLDVVYKHPMFEQWESMLNERLNYYTEKKTLAGSLADMTYKSIKSFNEASDDEFIVDIGCGDGSQLKYLKNKKNYIGVDRSLKRLEILKKKYPEATVIYADATKLPFKTGSISYIYSSNAFEHLWYLKEVIFECYRCTFDKGEMSILFPTEGGLWNLGRKIFSKPHFQKKNPSLDFELISHIEHCNNATQIIRTLETFFQIKRRYLPTRIPSIFFNALVEVKCKHFTDKDKHFELS